MGWTEPVGVDAMYGDWSMSDDEVEAVLDRSLNPRGSESLYDTVGQTGIGPSHLMLDIGARDAAHTLRLVDRLGCRAVAVEPVAKNVEDALARVADHQHGDRVEVRPGTIEAIPAGDGEFDLVFCRDMFSHIADPAPALAECRRVLKAGGAMVVYQTFATERLESAEAIHLFADLAIVKERMEVDDFERHALGAGFTIESVDPVGSEWREAWEEAGDRRTANQLLHAARLLRAKDSLLAELGEVPYRVMLANALWGVYQMIGKLEPRVYLLRR